MTIKKADHAKILAVIDHAVTKKQEIKELQDSLRDTIKDCAEQVGMPVGTLNKLIRIKYGDGFFKDNEELGLIADILGEAGVLTTDKGKG